MAGRRRQRVEHTEDWEQLRLLVKWPEQERYEEIRPLVLFGDSVFERTEETRTSEEISPLSRYTCLYRPWRFSADSLLDCLRVSEKHLL